MTTPFYRNNGDITVSDSALSMTLRKLLLSSAGGLNMDFLTSTGTSPNDCPVLTPLKIFSILDGKSVGLITCANAKIIYYLSHEPRKRFWKETKIGNVVRLFL